MGQEKSMRGGDEDPILRPRSAPLPSLQLCCFTIFIFSKLEFILISCRWTLRASWVCHVLQYWVGPACPLGFFSILSFYSAGHHLLGFILLLNVWAFLRPILLFKNDHFIMATSYALLFFERGPRPTLVFILYSQKYFSYLGHYLGLVYAFFFLWTFGIQPNCYFFAYALTHLLVFLELFSLPGFWA